MKTKVLKSESLTRNQSSFDNCNNCARRGCNGMDPIMVAKRVGKQASALILSAYCPGYKAPYTGWQLAELTLRNAQGLHDTLCNLPKEIQPKLDFCLSKR